MSLCLFINEFIYRVYQCQISLSCYIFAVTPEEFTVDVGVGSQLCHQIVVFGDKSVYIL